ncbi:MAG: tail-specific protease [Bdellovibrionales bacterium CG10_big_fil_rev_8_21_14_0_10_45_34]|nr:MAG: tail-specific protease [Bdellovibrionales bacterium CG10_big_fil_rev_8_21_14_0_10_45_34]
MLRRIFKNFSIIVLVVLASGSSISAELKCKLIPSIMNLMLGQHILFNEFSTNLNSRLIDQYIKSLDTTKTYLIQSDVKAIKDILSGTFRRFQKGACNDLDRVQKVFLKRVDERTVFAKKYLAEKDFKIDPKIEIQVSNDDREYPKTKSEAEGYLKKYIQWQVANFVASGTELKEAIQQVARRYERNEKNLKDVKAEDLNVRYLDSFANALDPHSSFLSKDMLEEFQINMRLSLEGIGATLSFQDGYTVVEQLVPGGAAAKSGIIEPQDKIVAVGEGQEGALEPVIDLSLKDVVKKIRGKKDTIVRLSILRKRADKPERFTVSLTRQKIDLEQEAAQIEYIEKEIDGKKQKYGVINLPSFYNDGSESGRSAARDVKKLLAEAEKTKVAGVVLDLSSNGGGSLDDAVSLAGLFFKTGNVVRTQGGRSSGKTWADQDSKVDFSGPLVVLVSRLSASASEIVAGALQDYKRAVIVGADHTFGKGSVQQVVPLPSQLGAFKVTMDMFFIPGGNSTQHRGVSSDIVFPSPFSSDDIGEKSLDYSLPPKTIPPFLSSEANLEDPKNRWNPVEKDWLKTLSGESKKRVDVNEDFKKIKDEVAKAEKRKKVLKIADVLESKDEKEKEKEAEDKKTKSAEAIKEKRRQDYLKRADIQEAVNIVADLSILEAKGSLKTTAKN